MFANTRIDYSTDGWLGRITISNPPDNKLSRPDFEEFETLRSFLATPDLKAIIVQGAGRHFSAGADIARLGEQLEDGDRFSKSLARGKTLLDELSSSTVPMMAVIRGSCLGAGLEIALSCHFRYASSNAILGFPESDHGFLPGFGGTLEAPRALGRPSALDLILSGRLIRGDEAEKIGLVDRAVPTRNLEDSAIAYLRSLTEGRTVSQVRAIVSAINNSIRMDRASAQAEETRLFIELATAGLRGGEDS